MKVKKYDPLKIRDLRRQDQEVEICYAAGNNKEKRLAMLKIFNFGYTKSRARQIRNTNAIVRLILTNIVRIEK